MSTFIEPLLSAAVIALVGSNIILVAEVKGLKVALQDIKERLLRMEDPHFSKE